MTKPKSEINWDAPFTASDFVGLNLAQERCADLANARFRELLAECEAVYSRNLLLWDIEEYKDDTHEAKLWGMKKVVR